ncbi:MAG: RNA polymerase sporulation sigma factor SigK [Clostridia bacterium]|nr:RNA polymerase sporulation sigma factor SigK [Clostridia bacterium]
MGAFFSLLFSNFIYLFLKVSFTQSFPPPLSPNEERASFEAMRAGDRDARGRLIEHNLRLVAHIVKKYTGGNAGQDDMISIGTIGLIKAIDSFDGAYGSRFATYAGKCIQNEILMHLRSQKKTACEVSINEAIDTDKDGNPLSYMDIISVDDTIADELDEKIKVSKVMKAIMSELDEREREIIILRYGLNNQKPITQREVAELKGISRSYVSRIEKSALEKLHRQM